MRRLTLAFVFLLLAAGAHGAGLVTEVFPLGFRTIDEVAPILKPLVPAPGAVTGLGNKVVVRTTPANMAEIRKVLAELDRVPRSLLVSVKRDALDQTRSEAAGVGVEIDHDGTGVAAGPRHDAPRGGHVGVDDGEGRRATARVYGAGSLFQGRGVQTIRALEGRDAFVSASVELPRRGRYGWAGAHGDTLAEGSRYRRVMRGFYVRPLVHGDRVRVEIRSADSRLTPGPRGMIRSHQADTVVSGPLGEWLVVGRERQRDTHSRGGIGYGAGAGSLGQSVLKIKVEVLH